MTYSLIVLALQVNVFEKTLKVSLVSHLNVGDVRKMSLFLIRLLCIRGNEKEVINIFK